ncbi:MAG TPA: TIGR03088 family PEP-CTERM/XrtA system glycosyltransferase [Casimicrobiaceae bacterium]|nr:TIGR03088 family PEP-CTERM/XrtA system glycosyltransferase [Casimicrobiaceae bacterium]
MSAPRSIVHVVYRFAVGGLENGLVNLVNRLPREHWRHTIVSLTEVDAAFARRIERPDVEVLALHKAPGHAVPLYPRLWRLFRERRPAIVHTRNLAALEALPIAWLAGVPVRIHGEHGRDAEDPDGTNVRRQRVRRLFRPFVTRYVALAPDLATYLVGPIGVPADRVDQIFNGVDTTRFSPATGRVPAPGCPFGPDDVLIGTAGRLDPVKDHANLLRAFARALALRQSQAPRLRLVIAGDGPERARVEALVREAGLEHSVWLTGERADVPDLLRGLDVFVLSSRGEGVSNTILEAMACGLPVVATRVGANADLVVDGTTGRIVPPSDSAALGDAIVAYADDPTLAKDHGRAGRQRAEQQFSLDRMVDRYHRLYLDAVGAARLDVAAAAAGGTAAR